MPTNIEIYKTVAAAVNSSQMVERIPVDDYTGFKKTVQGMTVDQLSSNGLINDFMTTMLNTIGRAYIIETNIQSRFGRFFRDTMEFGRFIQVSGVMPAVGMDYKSEMDATDFSQINPFLGQKPEIAVRFYQLNEKRRYAVYLNYMEFKQAFDNETMGFMTMIERIINSATDARNIDVDIFCRETFNDVINATGTDAYILQLQASQRKEISGFDTSENAVSSLATIQDTVTDMIIRASTDYNEAKFMSMQRPSNLILFVRKEVINSLNTQVAPFAYNADKLTFTPSGLGADIEVFVVPDFGGVIPVDSAGTQIYPKYNEIGQWTGEYVTESGGSSPATFDHFKDNNENVLAVLCDNDRLMIVNNKLFANQVLNAATGNAVYHLHDWNAFTQNQFRNMVVFTQAG